MSSHLGNRRFGRAKDSLAQAATSLVGLLPGWDDDEGTSNGPAIHAAGVSHQDPPDPTPRARGEHSPDDQAEAQDEESAGTGNASARPTLDEIGTRGAYYLLHEPEWIRRHVETITITGPRTAKRQVTIDVLLPRSEVCIADCYGEENLYYIPVAVIGKHPPTSNIDLDDEGGRSHPLLTREEDARVSQAALLEAGRLVTSTLPGARLRSAWNETVHQQGRTARVSAAVAAALLELEDPSALASPQYPFFAQAVLNLAGNSMLWLPMRGRPGQRRVLKLRYDLAIKPFSILRGRPSTETVTLILANGEEWELTEEDPGDGLPRPTYARLFDSVANALGLSPIPLRIETPYVRGSSTYHLQIESPPGLEIRKLSLLARLVDGDGREYRPEVQVDRGNAHLYVSHAKVVKLWPAVLLLRVGRRGFLSLSVLTAAIITGMLWIYDSSSDLLGPEPVHQEIAAAVLLVIPAFLTAFVARPNEHALTTRLMSGVRALLLLLGLLSAASAAALAGIKPPEWTLEHTWFVSAVSASIATGVLVLSWLFALDVSWWAGNEARKMWRDRALYLWSCVAGIATAGVVTGLGTLLPDAATWVRPLPVGILLLLGAALGYVGWSGPGTQPAPVAVAFAVLAGVVSDASALLLAWDSIGGIGWHEFWRWAALGLAALLLGLAVTELARYWRGQRASQRLEET
jgi:hypothetical protein